MRKNLLLGLGLLVVVGAVVSYVDASRYQYHLFQRYGYTQDKGCTNCHNTVRRTYARSYNNPYANSYRNVYRNQYKAQCDLRTEHGCHYFNRQNLYRPAKDDTDYKLQRPHLYPRVENTFQTNRLVVRNGNYKDRTVAYHGEPRVEDLQVVDPVHYSVDTYGFAADASGVYRQPGASLAYRVLESDEGYKCSQTNFWACVSRLTTNFQKSQNLGTVYNTNRDFRWNDTQHLSFTRFPVVTESFDAAGRSYFIMSALNPTDGSIIRIEGVAQQREKEAATRAMYQVFESFRFRQ